MDSRNLLIGNLILVRGHLYDPVDDAIKLGEVFLDHASFKNAHTHVAIYMGDEQVAEAQYGRVTGFAPLSDYEGDYDIGHLNLTDAERKRIHDRAVLDFGKPYNLLLDIEIGIDALTGIDVEHTEVGKYICSTFARDIIHDATGKLSNEKAVCTPEELARDPDVEVIPLELFSTS